MEEGWDFLFSLLLGKADLRKGGRGIRVNGSNNMCWDKNRIQKKTTGLTRDVFRGGRVL